MNPIFLEIISAGIDDRRDLFLLAANRLGIPLQNIEKDFWVCWILDLLFNGKDLNEPRLLFKGGTSLSKAYGFISRFSEDVDLTVFREDIVHEKSKEELEKLSGKKQRNYLDVIKLSCQNYIQGPLKKRLNRQIQEIFKEKIPKIAHVFLDPDDHAQQTLLIQYPSVMNDSDYYIKPTIKLEAGAKSAIEPHRYLTIKPYVADELDINLSVQNIATIHAERTFWDKVIILHGLRCWYENRQQLRQQGHRISRHYYDIYKLLQSPIGEIAKKDHALAFDCAWHAQLFFNSKDLNLNLAKPGTFRIFPTTEMIEILMIDYQAMSGMIFGISPDFSAILESIRVLENEINQVFK